jgi:3-dehydroquinate synthase
MTTIELCGRGGTVPYHIADGALVGIQRLLHSALGTRRYFVVSDATVAPLYGQDVARRLGAELCTVPAGEGSKRWASVEAIARFLFAHHVERDDVLVGIGGGVVTDMVGFAAAVTLRGIPWVAVPTTLLGMVDAAIGGKTGIDLDLGKNLIGAFWAPDAVVADPLVLLTLDQRQLRAGLAEVVKSAMISPSALEGVLDRALESVAHGDALRATELVVGAARVKAEIVALDERESGPREALNLGHTLGHALESATSYQRFLHGEAVAWGLLAALRLARNHGLLATAEAQAWAARVLPLAPLPPIADVGWEQLASFIARDKKRRGGSVRWVLPRLGGVVLGAEVSDDEAARVYGELCTLSPEGPFTSLF